MTFRGAVDVLAAKTFSGISSNFDHDQLPAVLEAAKLPALVLELVPTRDGQETQNLRLLTYDGAKWLATLYVQHTAYWLPVGDGLLKDYEPDVSTFVDTYLAKLALDGRLAGAGSANLLEELVVLSVTRGRFAYRQSDYDPKARKYEGVRFYMRWVMEVTAA